jgi:L-lactate utilization protein LutC
MPYELDGNCVVKEDGSPVPGGCHDTHEQALAHLKALEANVPEAKDITDKAEWDVASINNLPDSAFLFIESGGKKDADGKTEPRSLRHFPYRNSAGDIDLPHLRNAIGRIPQSNANGLDKNKVQAHAQKLLEDANKETKEASLLAQLIDRFDQFLASFKAGARHNKADQDALDNAHDAIVKAGADCPMSVFKDASGKWRWVTFSSSAYKDRDGEIVSLKAQEADIARLDASGDRGKLRWWHVGKPYTLKSGDWKFYVAGPGLDLGTCDYSAMQGRIRIESGTFDSDAVGEAFSKVAHKQSVSIGFSHPDDEPNGGAFENIHTFERSLLPLGSQSNYFASIPIIEKESNMDDKKLDALKQLVGDKVTEEILAKATETDKAAEAAGVKFKAKSVSELSITDLQTLIVETVKGASVTTKQMTCPKCGKVADAGDKYCDNCGAKLPTEGKATEPDEDDKSKKDHADASAIALKQVTDVLAKMQSDNATVAKQVNDQGQAIATLMGELPRSLSSLRRSNAEDNITNKPPKGPAQKSGDASGVDDFFEFAVTGSTNGNKKIPNG